ncbi:chorismate synthase [Bacteroidota bacterium]
MNSFGRFFRISIFGESHGNSVGVLIDGCPPGIAVKPNDFTKDINRRKPGGKGTTTRTEEDIPIIENGIFKGKTTGAPIHIRFENKNFDSKDYKKYIDFPRPGHADFTTKMKYKGFNDFRGGGHFSGRLTLGLVAAGVIAKKIIHPIKINAKLMSAGGSKNITKAVNEAVIEGDSIGGLIECKAINIPVGFGEPFFDSVESVISHIVFSIPAIKGIEFGTGLKAAEMKGSEFNDAFINAKGKTETNNSGGINGGITNGNPLIFKIAVKPPSGISLPQKTFNFKKKKMDKLIIKGRHDSCIALRMPVIVEAATAIALADFKLINLTYQLNK